MSILKNSIAVIALGFIGYHSVEIKKLDEVKQLHQQKFDATSFARTFLAKSLPPTFSKAVAIPTLTEALQKDSQKAFKDFSHALAIGNIRYFLVKSTGKITNISEDEISIQSGNQVLKIATEFIYGNAIRDAAGIFDMKPFTNTTDLNNISSEINKIVRTEIVPTFKKQIKVGDTIECIGTLELNQEHLPSLNTLEILPVSLQKISEN